MGISASEESLQGIKYSGRRKVGQIVGGRNGDLRIGRIRRPRSKAFGRSWTKEGENAIAERSGEVHGTTVVANEYRGLAHHGNHLRKSAFALQIEEAARQRAGGRRDEAESAPNYPAVRDVRPDKVREGVVAVPDFIGPAAVGEHDKQRARRIREKWFPFIGKLAGGRDGLERQRDADGWIQTGSIEKLLVGSHRMVRTGTKRWQNEAIIGKPAKAFCCFLSPFVGRTCKKSHRRGADEGMHIPNEIKALSAYLAICLKQPSPAFLATIGDDFMDKGHVFDERRKGVARHPSDATRRPLARKRLDDLQALHDVTERGQANNQQVARRNRGKGSRVGIESVCRVVSHRIGHL